MMHNQVENRVPLLNGQNELGLILSSDSKPRLKWTSELHQRFIDAVSHLGGPDKATPKTVMRMMGVPGLTLYHLKSHLQKYRLGKNQQSEAYGHSNKEDYRTAESRSAHISSQSTATTGTHLSEGLDAAKALQIQLDVQKKLHEQIEVQRHLQLRIEAQGKYLQSVLLKAQETLAAYNSSSVGLEAAKAEISDLITVVEPNCQNSLLSNFPNSSSIQSQGIGSYAPLQPLLTDCSTDSCLTSSESSERKEEKTQTLQVNLAYKFPLIEIDSNKSDSSKTCLTECVMGCNRTSSTVSDGSCAEQSPTKRELDKESSDIKLKKVKLLKDLDLNSSQYQVEIDSGCLQLDLNTPS